MIALPQRVRDELNEQQYKSELLVAGVQLSVIVLLSIINFFTPAGYAPTAPVHSAPLGLSLFSILILVRLWFAYTKQLTPLFLGFSVVAEMVLLLFIIWTYYLQFETTATINLKNPNIFYVFVLIALRALRFEPIWVILSGLTAALGWTIIVWHTLALAGMNVITWDYVTYASTRSVYLGTQFDIVFSILLMTAIIALVLHRAKQTVFQSVRETIAAKDLSRFFDSDVAKKITLSENMLQAGYGEIRTAAVLFTDMRGFTQASATLSPNDLIALLSEYQSLLVPIIQKHNGSIDKFMGDGILASFGAVSPSKTYAADALNAVDDIMQAVTQWRTTRMQENKLGIEVGAGLAVGEVLFGVIGNKDRLEYTVIGEVVNLAAKLEKQNKIEHTRVVATQITLDKAQEQNYMNIHNKELRSARSVLGVNEPINLVVLI